jgi:membrane-associated phospholipid phosphatase
MSSRAIDWLRNRTSLSDWVILILLFVIAATFTIRLPAVPQARLPWARHLGFLLAFATVVGAVAASPRSTWAVWSRAIATIAVLMFLYSSLGSPVFAIIPWRADRFLAEADSALFGGHSPALWAARHIGEAGLEFWSLIYGFFVPFLYLSIFLGCVGRPASEREEFLIGFSVTYAIAYLGYLFLPSTGPIEFFPSVAPPRGGPLHRLILSSVAATGGNHGAFPSLHVGASAYLCLFDWRHSLLRGMTYAPVVALIGFSTLFLQYHYVVDLLAGIAIAVFANRVAASWRPRRDSERPA